jgi:CRISPR system Cascade subunit CasB
MTPAAVAPLFWRLAAQHPDTIGRAQVATSWMEILRILAILTPKGDPESRSSLHNPRRRLGEVLCDGGDRDWVGPRPVVSELRLARLLSARGPQRADLLRHAARMVAHSRRDAGVNVADIAMVLLLPSDGRRLAEPYYRRLDRAEAAARNSEEGATE